MRYALIFFSFMFVVAFGAISLVESYTPANAGISAADDAPDDDDVYHDCHDDGDDGENPGVVDDPDSEENGGAGEEHGDGKGEDDDRPYEDDDPQNCRVILPDTQTPAPTPCPSIIQTGGGSECCPLGPGSIGDVIGEGFLCYCPDSADGEVVAEGSCYCVEGAQPFGCLCDLGANAPDCCVYQGGCASNLATAPADVNCDGDVTSQDAYEALVVLSGFESSTGDGCGGGDADCSDAVDAKDTLAILAIVAGLEEPAVC